MSQRGGKQGGKESGRKAASGESRTNVVQIQTYLKGMDYPAGSQELVQKAEDNGAPEDVIAVLEHMPKNKEFHSAAEVSQALGDIM